MPEVIRPGRIKDNSGVDLPHRREEGDEDWKGENVPGRGIQSGEYTKIEWRPRDDGGGGETRE